MDVNAPLTSNELRQLDDLMEIQGGRRLPWLHGYLTGVISARLFAVPKEWMPYIWKNGISPDVSLESIQDSIDAIMRLYSTIVGQLLEEEEFFPLLSVDEEPYEQASLNAEALQQWCRGYSDGTLLKEGQDDKADDEIAHFYEPIIALASSDEDVKKYLWEWLEEASIEEIRDMSRVALPVIISEIYHYWREKEAQEFALPNQMYTKTGRNDPCPCGSGKKFKKCCWQKMVN